MDLVVRNTAVLHAELTKNVLAIEELTPRSVVAVGTFDGVHVGHRRVLERAVALAAERLAPSVALTFHPHPMDLLDPPGPGRLSREDEKYRRLAACGVTRIAVLPFDVGIASWRGQTFVDEVLCRRLRATDVVVGFNFTFGKGGEADVEALTAMGRKAGFRVHVVAPVEVDGEVASSSSIRGALREGRVELAGRLLGRPYGLEGRVEPGAGRGHALGFPTANLGPDPEGVVVPGPGVYGGCGRIGGADYAALVYVGSRPTFERDGPEVVEVYLVGYEGGTLHGASLSVTFERRLRGERAFATETELKEQMLRDLACLGDAPRCRRASLETMERQS